MKACHVSNPAALRIHCFLTSCCEETWYPVRYVAAPRWMPSTNRKFTVVTDILAWRHADCGISVNCWATVPQTPRISSNTAGQHWPLTPVVLFLQIPLVSTDRWHRWSYPVVHQRRSQLREWHKWSEEGENSVCKLREVNMETSQVPDSDYRTYSSSLVIRIPG